MGAIGLALNHNLPIIALGHFKNSQEETMSSTPARAFLRTPLTALALSLLAAGLMAHSAAFAATKEKASKGGKKPPSKVTFIDSSSSENPAARVKRLKVECKGRPNAGMCLGHTR